MNRIKDFSLGRTFRQEHTSCIEDMRRGILSNVKLDVTISPKHMNGQAVVHRHEPAFSQKEAHHIQDEFSEYSRSTQPKQRGHHAPQEHEKIKSHSTRPSELYSNPCPLKIIK